MEILRFLVVVIGATLLFPEYARPFDITQSEYEDTNNHLLALQDVIIEPTSYRVDAYSDFNITFRLAPSYQTITLKLQPSLDIIAPDAYIRHLDKDGRSVHGGPIERSAHKVFKGIVFVEAKEGKLNVGWARIYMIRHGAKPLFEGTFTVYHEQYHVQLASTYSQFTRGLDRPGLRLRHRGPRQDDYIIAYRITDGDNTETKRSQDESICRVNTSPASTYADTETSELNDSLFTRQWGSPQYNDFRDHIGGTAGCPTSHRTALIGIVTDCTYTASFISADAAHQNIVNVVNSASEIFERSFNISLQIQNITISDPECPRTAPDNAPWNLPCAASDLQQRLNLFSSWRGSINDDLAYWTLMTSCPTGGEVGVAWVGQLCSPHSSRWNSQSETGASVVVRTSTEWQVFAHESGHIFGAIHDCESSTCARYSEGQCCPLSTSTCDAGGRYLMNPVSSRRLSQFSPCTIGNVCYMMGNNYIRTSCLREGGNNTTSTRSQCGNGIVEPGEDCDCGGDDSCQDAYGNCCNGRTCGYTNSCGTDSSGTNDGGDSSVPWVDDHLSLVIGLAAGIGGGLLLLILACAIISCRQRQLKRKARQKIMPLVLAQDMRPVVATVSPQAARPATQVSN